MNLSPISFKGSATAIDEIDIPRCVDYDYRHLYPRKAPVEQAQRPHSSSKTNKKTSSSDTFEYTPRQRSHQSSRKGKRAKSIPLGSRLAFLLAATLAIGGGAKAISAGQEASQAQNQNQDTFNKTSAIVEQAPMQAITSEQPVFYDEAENAVIIDSTSVPDEVQGTLEEVSDEAEATDTIVEEPETDYFDFEISLCPEQEYSVNKFVENWENNHERYETIEAATGVPAELVAAIHWREASGNFNRCLHDGTKIGEPIQSPMDNGKVFWSFEDSAIAVLSKKYDGSSIIEGDYDTYFDFAERYNGLGYRNGGRVSPYVWAGTDNYVSGKYVADGHFDPNYVDKQPGVAVLLASIC